MKTFLLIKLFLYNVCLRNISKSLFLIFISQTMFSQPEFAPIGAKWYYTAPLTGECIAIEAKKDTIIKGESCRKIEIKKCNNTSKISNEFLWQVSDSILYYNYATDTFHLLYNFSAKLNDTIIVHNNWFKPNIGFYAPSTIDSVSSFKYKIVAIDSVNVSSQWHKRQLVSYIDNSAWGFAAFQADEFIIEKIGAISYLLGRTSNSTPEDYPGLLRCYSDSAISYLNPEWTLDCDYNITSHVQDRLNYLVVYPMPFNNILHLKNEGVLNACRYRITDINGKVLIENSLEKSEDIITTALLPGVYFLHLSTNENYETLKLIKQ
ncbi:MAG: T9SS type A sorting domain-containing protein [Bacteroidales bacterium]|nr:T9SS type A sorting domain-containing protein [Bacteroidales bacterium]